jgi:hypothetical protein
MVVAGPNMGKSTIIKKLLRLHEPTWRTDASGSHLHCPLIGVNVPDNPTERTFAERVAKGLTDKPLLIECYAKNRSRLYQQLVDCGVTVIALDNCQRFYNAGTKTNRRLRDFLCDLTDVGIHLALFGSNPMVPWVKGNDHLLTRVVQTVRIRPFGLNAQYRQLLDVIERNLPLREQSHLSRDFTKKFHSNSGGTMGKTIRIARRCAVRTLEDGGEKIVEATFTSVLNEMSR